MSTYPGQEGPTWPPIDHNDKKEVIVSRDRLKSIIDDLKTNDLNRYTTQHGKAGLPDDLQAVGGKIQAKDVGATGGGGDSKTSYPAGEKIFEMIQKVNDGQNGFPALYRQFVQSYGEVINALYTNAGFYEDADQASKLPPGTGSQNNGGDQSYNNGQQQS
ncbi:MAG: hypothetical protein ACRDP6_37035 [Actinoallomurus sp.]